MTNVEPRWTQGGRVTLVYQPMAGGAEALARLCADALAGFGAAPEVLASTDLGPGGCVDDSRLAVTFGGDGTILRTAQWLGGRAIPIVGVQMGRLGFLAEVVPGDVPGALFPYIEGDWWPDRRAMLEGCIRASTGSASLECAGATPSGSVLALNDVVVCRGASPRTVAIDLALGDRFLHTFRCDGLIVASATGSTAYSFAAGGPILAPESRELVVTAICPHISSLRTLVLPGDSPLRLHVRTTETAVATFDGQTDLPVRDGGVVEVRRSSHVTVFARRGTPADFYSRVLSKLG